MERSWFRRSDHGHTRKHAYAYVYESNTFFFEGEAPHRHFKFNIKCVLRTKLYFSLCVKKPILNMNNAIFYVDLAEIWWDHRHLALSPPKTIKKNILLNIVTVINTYRYVYIFSNFPWTACISTERQSEIIILKHLHIPLCKLLYPEAAWSCILWFTEPPKSLGWESI